MLVWESIPSPKELVQVRKRFFRISGKDRSDSITILREIEPSAQPRLSSEDREDIAILLVTESRSPTELPMMPIDTVSSVSSTK